MEDSTTQSDPTPQTFAYRNGIRAAKGVKWVGKKLRALDNACVANVKRKNRPVWLGHVPLVMISLTMILVVTALLTYWIVTILSTLGLLVIAYSAITNLSGEDFTANSSYNNDPLIDRTYDGFNSIDDGAPYGESYGTWSDND
ncbi:DUF3742 domain-containing protein [Morganella morganii]|nr:DUF3742 domain-containing protein [Morganella morganii]